MTRIVTTHDLGERLHFSNLQEIDITGIDYLRRLPFWSWGSLQILLNWTLLKNKKRSS